MSIFTRMKARHAQRAAERRMIEDAYAAFDQLETSRLDRYDMTQEACDRLLLAVYEEECTDPELPTTTIYRKRHPRRIV